MRPTVLRRGEPVGAVEVPGIRLAVRQLLELEAERVRRPVDGLVRVRIAEVHPAPAGPVEGRRYPRAGVGSTI
jgi:hypothetical protein